MSARNFLHAALIVLLLMTSLPWPNFDPLNATSAHFDWPAASVAQAQAPPGQKILVEAGDEKTLKQLAASGAVQLADYGAFSLWQVTSVQMAALPGQATLSARPNFDTIPLRGGQVINTGPGESEPVIPDKLRQDTGEEPEFGLVQFIGPIKDEWLAAVTDPGRLSGLAGHRRVYSNRPV